MPVKRSAYHHGDLRAALIRAADEITAEGGLEAFSLRAAAYHGKSAADPSRFEDSAAKELPKVHERLYPDRREQCWKKENHTGET